MEYLDQEIEWKNNQINTAEVFPKEYKASLKTRLQELLMWSRSVRMDDMGSDWKQAFLDQIEQERQDTVKKLRMLEWRSGKRKKNGTMDIASARQYPISLILEMKRNICRCPWHSDKHPSAQYYPKQNKIYCFVCQRGGDAIDVAQQILKLNFKDAVRYLCQK